MRDDRLKRATGAADVTSPKAKRSVNAGACWTHFEHQADIGVRGLGPSRESAFEQAALALTAVVTPLDRVQPDYRVDLACEAADDESLLVAWLNALVYKMAVRRMLFSRFRVTIDGHRLLASAWGEPIALTHHQPTVEIKGATFTALRVARNEQGHWLAQTVLDL